MLLKKKEGLFMNVNERFEITDGNPPQVKDKFSSKEFVLFSMPDTYMDFRYLPGFLIPYGYDEERSSIIMEAQSFETLSADDILDENTLKEKVLPLLLALKAMHEKGMVYGNLSPDKIIVTENGFFLRDLGIGKEPADKNQYSAYEYYAFHGKGCYASDVYSLCAVIYELLTSISLPDAFTRSNGNEEIESLSAFGVSKETENVIEKGLRVFQDDRYFSAKEMLEDWYAEKEIEGYINDYQIFIRPTKTEEEDIAEKITKEQQRIQEDKETEEEPAEEEEKNEGCRNKKQMLIIPGILIGVLILVIAAKLFSSDSSEEEVRVIQNSAMPVTGTVVDYSSYEDSVSGSSVSGASVSGSSVSGSVLTAAPVSEAAVTGSVISGSAVTESPASGSVIQTSPAAETPAATTVPTEKATATPKATKKPKTTKTPTKKPKKTTAPTNPPVTSYQTPAPTKKAKATATPKPTKKPKITIDGKSGILID